MIRVLTCVRGRGKKGICRERGNGHDRDTELPEIIAGALRNGAVTKAERPRDLTHPGRWAQTPLALQAVPWRGDLASCLVDWGSQSGHCDATDFHQQPPIHCFLLLRSHGGGQGIRRGGGKCLGGARPA